MTYLELVEKVRGILDNPRIPGENEVDFVYPEYYVRKFTSTECRQSNESLVEEALNLATSHLEKLGLPAVGLVFLMEEAIRKTWGTSSCSPGPECVLVEFCKQVNLFIRVMLPSRVGR